MDSETELGGLEREKEALLEEAAQIVRLAESERRPVTAEEDARVLVLMARLRNLEERMRRLKHLHHTQE